MHCLADDWLTKAFSRTDKENPRPGSSVNESGCGLPRPAKAAGQAAWACDQALSPYLRSGSWLGRRDYGRLRISRRSAAGFPGERKPCIVRSRFRSGTWQFSALLLKPLGAVLGIRHDLPFRRSIGPQYDFSWNKDPA